MTFYSSFISSLIDDLNELFCRINVTEVLFIKLLGNFITNYYIFVELF